MKPSKNVKFILDSSVILGAIFFVIFGSGCTYKKITGGDAAVTDQKLSESSVDFLKVQELILSKRCQTCHNQLTSAGLGLSNYNDVLNWVKPGDAQSSKLYQDVFSGNMPKNEGRLSDKEIEFIKNWINDGAIYAVDATPPPVVVPPPVIDYEPTFASIKSKIYDVKCARCHTGTDNESGIDLTGYDNFKIFIAEGSPDDSPIYLDVMSGNMPKGGPMLSTKEIEAIETWIINGALNN